MANTPDYDTASISVFPNTLVRLATGLNTDATDVADTLGRINKQTSDLALGWAGRTEQEAKDFSDRWMRVMGELFGTEKKPDDGVLNAIVDGLGEVADGFAKTEYALLDVFQKFQDSVGMPNDQGTSGSAAPTPNLPPPDVTDPAASAITEVWWGAGPMIR